MAERLKSKLLDQQKLADLVVGPDAYRDLPRILAAVQVGQEQRVCQVWHGIRACNGLLLVVCGLSCFQGGLCAMHVECSVTGSSCYMLPTLPVGGVSTSPCISPPPFAYTPCRYSRACSVILCVCACVPRPHTISFTCLLPGWRSAWCSRHECAAVAR